MSKEFKPFRRVFVGSNDANFSIAGFPKLEHGKEYEITKEIAMKAGINSEEDFDAQMIGTIVDEDGKPASVFAKARTNVAKEATADAAKEDRKAERAAKKAEREE